MTQGNELFRSEKWGQAAEKYRAAALLAGPQPVYLSNLAAALLKLKLYVSYFQNRSFRCAHC